MGSILALQIPPERIGVSAYVLVFSGLVLMFCGYYIGKRGNWK